MNQRRQLAKISVKARTRVNKSYIALSTMSAREGSTLAAVNFAPTIPPRLALIRTSSHFRLYTE